MIKETFIALKAIGVSDQHILDVIAAFEARHDEYRHDIHKIERNISVLNWMMIIWPPLLFGLGVTILLRVW